MSFTPKNNYDSFKQDFKKDTALEADKHLAEYIAYYNARMTDMQYQLDHYMANQWMNQFGILPTNIGLRVSEAIKSLPKNINS